MTYCDYVIEYINKCPLATPIYASDIGAIVAKDYAISADKANAAVAVAMKRIMDRKLLPDLKFYQKGIYYRSEATPFGDAGIDKEKLIARKYLDNDQGYETGTGMLYRLGLTTQLPNMRLIATNAAKDCKRKDPKLKVSVCPARVTVTKDNKDYLQILDSLEMMDRAPIDVDEPYKILAAYIEHKGLHYDKLLSLADKYYPQRTVIQLAHTASKREMIVSS